MGVRRPPVVRGGATRLGASDRLKNLIQSAESGEAAGQTRDEAESFSRAGLLLHLHHAICGGGHDLGSLSLWGES